VIVLGWAFLRLVSFLSAHQAGSFAIVMIAERELVDFCGELHERKGIVSGVFSFLGINCSQKTKFQ
jgi:hypothetical protein